MFFCLYVSPARQLCAPIPLCQARTRFRPPVPPHQPRVSAPHANPLANPATPGQRANPTNPTNPTHRPARTAPHVSSAPPTTELQPHLPMRHPDHACLPRMLSTPPCPSTASRHTPAAPGTPPGRSRNATGMPTKRPRYPPIQMHCFLTFCALLTSLWKKMEEIGNIWKITPIFAVKVRKGFRKRENLDGIPGGQAP